MEDIDMMFDQDPMLHSHSIWQMEFNISLLLLYLWYSKLNKYLPHCLYTFKVPPKMPLKVNHTFGLRLYNESSYKFSFNFPQFKNAVKIFQNIKYPVILNKNTLFLRGLGQGDNCVYYLFTILLGANNTGQNPDFISGDIRWKLMCMHV